MDTSIWLFPSLSPSVKDKSSLTFPSFFSLMFRVVWSTSCLIWSHSCNIMSSTESGPLFDDQSKTHEGIVRRIVRSARFRRWLHSRVTSQHIQIYRKTCGTHFVLFDKLSKMSSFLSFWSCSLLSWYFSCSWLIQSVLLSFFRYFFCRIFTVILHFCVLHWTRKIFIVWEVVFDFLMYAHVTSKSVKTLLFDTDRSFALCFV